jgi:regulation of enolase protein 1 (concanavalin A-like superfamily)
MKKKYLLLALISILCKFTTQAQNVKISSIPYPMHFENKALDYKVINENSLKIIAPANTDLFISPDGGYTTDKSPRLIFRPDSDFILTARITPDFQSKWDAGVLLIFNDSKHFAKFCFESDFKGQPRVVSVVCNEVADDCNSMVINSKYVYYRIIGSVKGNTFGLYYSENGKTWFPIRGFKLTKTDNLQIGFSAQSPAGKGCSVDFTDINFQNRKPKDYWTGE